HYKTLTIRKTAAQKQGAGKGRAEKRKVQTRKNQPPAGDPNPGISPRHDAGRGEGEEKGGEQNGELGPQQLVVNETAAADGGGKQKGHLRLTEGQSRPLSRQDPG